MISKRKSDKEFIDDIMAKVRYLEYLQREEEKVRENSKRLMISKIKLGAVLLVLAAFLCIPVLAVEGLGLFAALIAGLVILSSGILFEVLYDMDIYSIRLPRLRRH